MVPEEELYQRLATVTGYSIGMIFVMIYGGIMSFVVDWFFNATPPGRFLCAVYKRLIGIRVAIPRWITLSLFILLPIGITGSLWLLGSLLAARPQPLAPPTSPIHCPPLVLGDIKCLRWGPPTCTGLDAPKWDFKPTERVIDDFAELATPDIDVPEFQEARALYITGMRNFAAHRDRAREFYQRLRCCLVPLALLSKCHPPGSRASEEEELQVATALGTELTRMTHHCSRSRNIVFTTRGEAKSSPAADCDTALQYYEGWERDSTAERMHVAVKALLHTSERIHQRGRLDWLLSVIRGPTDYERYIQTLNWPAEQHLRDRCRLMLRALRVLAVDAQGNTDPCLLCLTRRLASWYDQHMPHKVVKDRDDGTRLDLLHELQNL